MLSVATPTLEDFFSQYQHWEEYCRNEFQRIHPEQARMPWLIAIDDSGIQASVKQFLGKFGITKLGRVIIGTNSVVFHTVHHQILRISNPETDGNLPDKTYEVLQPLISKPHNGFLMEIYPEVDLDAPPGRDKQKDCDALFATLAGKGLFFWDAKPDNVGYLCNGTPVIIDRSAVIPKKDMRKTILTPGATLEYWDYFAQLKGIPRSYRTVKRYLENSRRHSGLNDNFEMAQAGHIKALGLAKDRMRGTITSNGTGDEKKISAETSSPWDKLIDELGGYRPMIGKLLDAAFADPAKHAAYSARGLRRHLDIVLQETKSQPGR